MGWRIRYITQSTIIGGLLTGVCWLIEQETGLIEALPFAIGYYSGMTLFICWDLWRN